VNINSATQERLESVPGIGPALASRIIAGRPYQSVDDLLRVSGIGERTLESMRPFLTADDETQQ
jgi:competence protein ComEA